MYNIHPLVNVGLNKTWSFAGLGLNISSVYYIVVRASSESGVVTQAISNGVKVVGPTMVTPGSVEVARLVSLTSTYNRASYVCMCVCMYHMC